MVGEPSPFEDWLGRDRDDDRLKEPSTVRDAVRYVFRKRGDLLLLLIVFGFAAYFVTGVRGAIVWGGMNSLLALAVVLGSAIAFRNRPIVLVAVAATAAVIVAGLWWGATSVGLEVIVYALVPSVGFGGIILYYVHEVMRNS